MANAKNHAPASYKGVMVSSTFTELKKHRSALMDALRKVGLVGIGMEDYVPIPGDDVISSSLNMVRDGSAYIGLISHRCGQIEKCGERNPHEYSITRLEFEEAERLKRPTLVFIMGDEHLVRNRDTEKDNEKIIKLEAFRERAKKGRIYVTFQSLREFVIEANRVAARLRQSLDEQSGPATVAHSPDSATVAKDKTIPTPPELYAEPRYIGSHDFVGRRAQLDILSDWAAPAESHPVLLFEAIGGAGKSMLTWEWVQNHAAGVRDDWAGMFWYSFYERGAVMADFCRHALAYITGQPLEGFEKKKTPELSEMLLRHLQVKPWLIVFDGLERVLVAYNRSDAAQITDEEAEDATDQIANRDPCAAIRPDDDDLLHSLAACVPSKLLLTSRLVPRVLMNQASQPIPGVLRERLPGLRPSDAEALIRSCGITGDSKNIQAYLQSNCDCHPLVIGALAGVIDDYLTNPGSFDAWVADPAGGGKLNLAELDLIQKRNHILNAALTALDDKSRQMLSTVALVTEGVDYPTIAALSPFEEAERKTELPKIVSNLRKRGLMQFDARSKRYDLHPVVRGIASGGLNKEETERFGQRVVDHFSQQAHSHYNEAKTLDDLADGLHVVRTLIRMGQHEKAYRAYGGDLSNALLFNVAAYAEVLAVLRPFFPKGWGRLPKEQNASIGSYLAKSAGIALNLLGEEEEALKTFGAALRVELEHDDWFELGTSLGNISASLSNQNLTAKAARCDFLRLALATQIDNEEGLFMARLYCFGQFTTSGRWSDAEEMWQFLDPMGRNWSRSTYRPGSAEQIYAMFRYFRGNLKEKHLIIAEKQSREGRNRASTLRLLGLRGQWRLEQGEYSLAAGSLQDAVRMAREVGIDCAREETLLALARFHLDHLSQPRKEAERLAKAKRLFDHGIAELWFAIGDREQAKKHALKAYKLAWADGEPYVRRFELNKARDLLNKLDIEIPNLPPYDPDKDEKLPWEDKVVAAIAKLRAENEAKAAKKAAEK